MMKWIDFKRFKSQPQNSQQNILSYLFFYITFMYGVTCAFFLDAAEVAAPALVALAIPPLVWGIISLLVILSVAFSIFFKWRNLAKTTGAAGFLLWVYVAIMAIITGSWFPLVVIILPMLVFWFFWFMGVNEDNGKQATDSG